MSPTTNIVAVIFLLVYTIPSTELKLFHRRSALTAIDYRLNNDVIPTTYNLELILDSGFEKTKEFKGRVEITFSLKPGVVRTFKPIKLHMKNITLDGHHGITLRSMYDNTNLLGNISKPNDQLEMIILQPREMLTNTQYILTILYTASFQSNLQGFYLSSYLNGDKNTEWLATTQFQATHARKAFPCFDEPNLKAVFHITIIHPKVYHALSNADVQSIS
ncbi:hypothetical protein ILUMI_17989, partial [Ignelater luminosus]